jgi:hypothetical protein
MDRLDFRTPLLCMKCGQIGTVTWEPGRLEPVGTSSQFYMRVKVRVKIPLLGADIVCARCGAVHLPMFSTLQAQKRYVQRGI